MDPKDFEVSERNGAVVSHLILLVSLSLPPPPSTTVAVNSIQGHCAALGWCFLPRIQSNCRLLGCNVLG